MKNETERDEVTLKRHHAKHAQEQLENTICTLVDLRASMIQIRQEAGDDVSNEAKIILPDFDAVRQ